MTYAIAGGPDDWLFNIDSATGVVTFKTAPDFESPHDDGFDNQYNLVVAATNAAGRTTQSVSLNVTDVADLNPPVDGNGGANVINGTSGNDWLRGLAGNDTIAGGGGDDLIDGGSGVDRMAGGAGNDIYIVDSVADRAVEAQDAGLDEVRSSTSYALSNNVENLILTGTGNTSGNGNASDNLIVGNSANNVLTGNAGNDTLVGGSGNDTQAGGIGNDLLVGGAGNDTLAGGQGNDVIIGGLGRDQLLGGNGNDILSFAALAESGVGAGQRDVVGDFNDAADRLDFSMIDAVSGGGDDAFTYIGSAEFSHVAGQLHVIAASSGNTLVEADVDGDAAADLQVQLTGIHTLDSGDLIL